MSDKQINRHHTFWQSWKKKYFDLLIRYLLICPLNVLTFLFPKELCHFPRHFLIPPGISSVLPEFLHLTNFFFFLLRQCFKRWMRRCISWLASWWRHVSVFKRNIETLMPSPQNNRLCPCCSCLARQYCLNMYNKTYYLHIDV